LFHKKIHALANPPHDPAPGSDDQGIGNIAPGFDDQGRGNIASKLF